MLFWQRSVCESSHRVEPQEGRLLSRVFPYQPIRLVYQASRCEADQFAVQRPGRSGIIKSLRFRVSAASAAWDRTLPESWSHRLAWRSTRRGMSVGTAGGERRLASAGQLDAN